MIRLSNKTGLFICTVLLVDNILTNAQNNYIIYQDPEKNGLEFDIRVSHAPTEVESVDLGLSVNWCNCNLGATIPEDNGLYYAWGEVTTKSSYLWTTYKYCGGTYNSLTKYNANSSYGIVDNKTTLEPEDDIAYLTYGGSWRMPTADEFEELLSKCTWQWISGPVLGYKVMGTNGNSIFLPLSGAMSSSNLDYVGEKGLFWSSSLRSDGVNIAMDLCINDNGKYWGNANRCFGRAIRPVRNDITLTIDTKGGNNPSIIKTDINTKIKLTAQAENGFNFYKWSDGNTDNPRTILVTEDATFIATFVVSQETDLDKIESSLENIQKIIKNNRFYILRDGKTYTTQGAEVK